MNNNLNVFNSHDLITRAQTYVLDKKLLTVHANDRDINKYPYANNFEIELPETINNIQSLTLVQSCFPMRFITFSNEYQNTKMSFTIKPQERADISDQLYIILAQNSNHVYTITIQEGTYAPDELCLELQRKMNLVVSEFLFTNGLPGVSGDYEHFFVTFDSVSGKIFFGNNVDNFTLEFDKQEQYTLLPNCKQPLVWEQYTHWGLPHYLGYEKIKYTANPPINKTFSFYYREEPLWLKSVGVNEKIYVVKAPFMECLKGDSVIYMMVDKYNSMDEIIPYSTKTNNVYNNDYNGTVNAAFEKIPINDGEIHNSRNNFFQNVSHYETPIENIRKLKFQFRFHDGRLVDFQNCDFNITIAFNCFRDEIERKYKLRIPHDL